MGKHYTVYTDGSFDKDMVTAGFSAVFINDEEKVDAIVYGRVTDSLYVQSWNVGGEIFAVQEAIRYAMKNKITNLTIYHDYVGLEKWYTRKWKCKNNLTRAYRAFLVDASSKVSFKFVWVRGHSNNVYNDIADKYAKEGIYRGRTINIIHPSEHERFDL